jgi:hypothetical protein
MRLDRRIADVAARRSSSPGPPRDLVTAFLAAELSSDEEFRRRVARLAALERDSS